MLNTQFPSGTEKKFGVDTVQYVLPETLQVAIAQLNSESFSEHEFRTQPIYGDEIWRKIKSLNLENFNWRESTVLDVACGGGFLSYHLLNKVKIKQLTLTDISKEAVDESKRLISTTYPNTKVDYLVADILKSNIPDNSYDMIIGNSFIHHFYNLPSAFKEFNRMLKPGGIFVSLHEPMPGALAYESANPIYLLMWFFCGKKYINHVRKIKGDFPLKNNTGGDVWLFEKDELSRLLSDTGFTSISTHPWHLLKSLFLGLFRLHLNEKRLKLNRLSVFLLSQTISIDAFLSKVIPFKKFGSIAIAARKKE